jgi:hypothetical protein
MPSPLGIRDPAIQAILFEKKKKISNTPVKQ